MMGGRVSGKAGGGNHVPRAPLHGSPVASPSTSRVFVIIGIRGFTFRVDEEEVVVVELGGRHALRLRAEL
jgi:hypothetical protein